MSPLAQFSFDLIIVDEAAQSMELSTLIPLRFNCSKMILVGVFTYECMQNRFNRCATFASKKSDAS